MAGVNFRFAVYVVTDEEIFQMLAFLEYVVLSPSWYELTQCVLFNLGGQWLLEYSATIQLDFREYSVLLHYKKHINELL